MPHNRRTLKIVLWLAVTLSMVPRLQGSQFATTGLRTVPALLHYQSDKSVEDPEAATDDSSPGTRPRVLADPFQTPRQLLRLLDIVPSDLNSFVDGEPIGASDEEAFLKLLFRMPQIGLDDIARWLRDPVPWDELAGDPSQWRGEFFLLRGRVREITQKRLRDERAELFDLEHYWEVRVEVPGTSTVTVCARSIPRAWQDRHEIDERCEVRGMFLKLAAAEGKQPQFLFAAPHVAWLPDRPNRQLGIGPDQVLLGNLGMDVGLFDAVRSRNSLPINAAERECFYALLHAAHQATAAEVAQHATDMELGPLLQQPQRLHGNVLGVHGTVQRITRVVVDERDIQERYGIDFYYQLDVLVPLHGTEVQIKGDQKGKSGPVYRSNFPFTCCTLSIPPQWEPFVGKERASARAVFDGFFFKIWAYSNPYVAAFNKHQRQLSPMLILHRPQPAPSTRVGKSGVSFAIGAGFLTVLAAIWGTIWLLNRTDRKHASTTLQQRFQPQEQPDFKGLEDPDQEPPAHAPTPQ